MSLKDICTIFKFNDFGDERGKLVVIEGGIQIPFKIKRVFYMCDSAKEVKRGQHANRESDFVLVNVSGSCKIRVTNGKEEMFVVLDKMGTGIYIPKMIWKDMFDFSSDSILLILANTHYSEQEYIRDYKQYLKEMEAFVY